MGPGHVCIDDKGHTLTGEDPGAGDRIQDSAPGNVTLMEGCKGEESGTLDWIADASLFLATKYRKPAFCTVPGRCGTCRPGTDNDNVIRRLHDPGPKKYYWGGCFSV